MSWKLKLKGINWLLRGTKINKKELREWINTFVAIIGLAFLIYGTIWGVKELQDFNINLKDINSDKISTKNIQIVGQNKTQTSCIYIDSGGNTIFSPCPD